MVEFKGLEANLLRDVVDGFNKQAIAMPAIALRYLELEGEFKKSEIDEALELYKDIVDNKLKGKNVTVCQLAVFHVLAELVIQARISNIPIPATSNDGYA